MSRPFDPYLQWLGIRDPERPPNHYRLLGVELFESDPDILLHAADRQMAHVRSFQAGPNSAQSQRLLNELAAAKVCLLNPAKKAAYDAELRARLFGAPAAAPAPAPMAVPPSLESPLGPPPVPWAGAGVPGMGAPPGAVAGPGTASAPYAAMPSGPAGWSPTSASGLPSGAAGLSPGAATPASAGMGAPGSFGAAPGPGVAFPHGPTTAFPPAASPLGAPESAPSLRGPILAGSPSPEVAAAAEPETVLSRGSPWLSGTVAALLVLGAVLAAATIAVCNGWIPSPLGDETAGVSAEPGADEPGGANSAPTDPTNVTDSTGTSTAASTGSDLSSVEPPAAEPAESAAELCQLARSAFQRRDLAAAAEALEKAERVAQASERLEVTHLREVLAYLEKFWDAYGAGRRELATGSRFQIGEKHVVVVFVDETELTVTDGARQYRYRDDDIPPSLAMAIAQPALDENPSDALAAKAALAIVDRRGDLRKASDWLQQAVDLGLPISGLVEEYRRRHESAATVASVEGTQSAEPADLPSAPPIAPPLEGLGTPKADDARQPLPDAAAQDEALQTIRALFADEYAKAKKPAERGALGATLYRKGMETTDDTTARYMLLCEARDLAAEAGQSDVFRKCVRALGREYRVDATAMAADVLARNVRRVREKDADRKMVDVATEFCRQAMADDRFAEATKLAEAARDLARKTQDTKLIKEAVAQLREVELGEQRYSEYRRAAAALTRDPGDAAAHAQVGRYLCFFRDQWAEGLPHLLLGGDAVLRDLAQAELAAARSIDAPRKVALGDQWWEAADSVADEAQALYRSRAAHWYREALPELTGLTETRVKHRLDQLASP